MKPFTPHTFQLFLEEHKLMASRSLETGEIFLPPRAICPATHSTAMEWVELSGRGELAAFTTIHIGPTEMVEAGYDRLHPYCSGIVRLAEGPMMSAQIIGVDTTRPETITIGAPVQATYLIRGEGEKRRTILAFVVQA